VAAVPGVKSASLSNHEILGRGRTTETISFAGTTAGVSAHIFAVTPSYFETVGMALARGRNLTAQDHAGAARVAVVNETLVRQVFGDEDPLGRRFRIGDPTVSGPASIEVVGVVKDAKINSLREPPRPTVYQPRTQSPDTPLNGVQVRAAGDPAGLAEQVRRTLASIHPGLRITGVRTMTEQVESSLRSERLMATLATAFGLVALFLVCVGLYGVISQWATQRTREIGVRMALGATTGGVRWLVLRKAFVLVLIGVAAGVPAAMAGAHSLKSLLYGMSPMDPSTLVLAAVVMFVVATLAAYLPARRASRVDPMMALRWE
jgi:predicted permease